jgi:hypothetical protein
MTVDTSVYVYMRAGWGCACDNTIE